MCIGLVEYVSAPGTSAYERAIELADRISSNGTLTTGSVASASLANTPHVGPLALKAAKQAISRATEMPLEAGLDFERASYESLLRSKDRDEALLAFKEKRKPVFKGE